MSVIQIPAVVPDRIQVEYEQPGKEPIVRSLSVDLVMAAMRQYAEDGKFDLVNFGRVMQAPEGVTDDQLKVLLGSLDPVVELYSKKKLGERYIQDITSRTTSTDSQQKPGISPERSADSIKKDFDSFGAQLSGIARS